MIWLAKDDLFIVMLDIRVCGQHWGIISLLFIFDFHLAFFPLSMIAISAHNNYSVYYLLFAV